MNGKEKMNPLEDNKLDGVSGGYSGKTIETIFTIASFFMKIKAITSATAARTAALSRTLLMPIDGVSSYTSVLEKFPYVLPKNM